MTITAISAALLGLFFLALSVNVVRPRRATRVSLGAGDDPLLERRIPAHGNFAEYTPIALVLIAMVAEHELRHPRACAHNVVKLRFMRHGSVRGRTG